MGSAVELIKAQLQFIHIKVFSSSSKFSSSFQLEFEMRKLPSKLLIW